MISPAYRSASERLKALFPDAVGPSTARTAGRTSTELLGNREYVEMPPPCHVRTGKLRPAIAIVVAFEQAIAKPAKVVVIAGSVTVRKMLVNLRPHVGPLCSQRFS